MQSSGKQWLMIGGAFLACTLLLLAPRTPSGNSAGIMPSASERTSAVRSVDQRVAEAVALVKGSDPMQGIMALRAILKEDSNNVEAHWQLGAFSVQSGQLDKAIGRFRKVTALEPTRAEAWLELGRTYAALDSVQQAQAAIMTFKTMVTDPAALAQADAIIAGLTNEKQ